MKITIDTRVDTHDEIRTVLKILTSILDKKNVNDDLQQEVPADTTSMMNMFSHSEPQKAEPPERAPDFSSFLNLTRKPEEDKKTEPQIQFF